MGDVSALQTLHANSERGELVFNGTGFDDPNYDGTTANWLNTLTAAHLVPLPLLNSYDDHASTTYTNSAAWGTAVAAWCATYCAGGTFWVNNTSGDATYAPYVLEILNEPYGNWYRNGAVDPTSYANMLIAIRQALDAAGLQRIRILGAAQVLYDNGFTAGVASAGGYQAVQGLDIHPYSSNPVAPPYTATLTAGWDLVYYLHQQYGLDAYVTEDGWCIDTSSVVCGDSGNVPESQKDQDITNVIGQLATVSWIQGFWYFNLHPYSGNTYGLDDANGNPTPAFTAFEDAAIANGF